MASLAPRPSRTRQQNSRPTPPELNLKDSTHRQSKNLSSSSNSFSSINSQPSQPFHQHHGAIQGQGQQKQALFPPSPDPQSGGGGIVGGVAHFQYSAHHPSYRPYTPTTPTTASYMNTLAMPVTPTLAAFGSGSSYPASPRPDRSPSFSTQGQSKASSSSSNLLPYMKNQRSSSTRRMPSSESSLYDPYRSRQPAVSANRVKNEYQAHSPIRETYTAYPPSIYNYYSRHGSSEEVHELHPHSREGGALTEEGFVMVPPPSIGQKEDHYRQSPTLTASQTLAANYGTHSESSYQTYLPYQPYSSQHALPSPSMNDVYRANSSLPSPGLGPLHTTHPSEERSEYKADPYRSAYSQSTNNHHINNHNHPYGSSYQGSVSGSPNPNDFSSSFESKFSAVSSQQQSNGSSGSSNNTRYPTRDLAGQDSSQVLSTSFQETGSSLTLQQQQPQPQQQNQATTASSETAGPSLDKDVDNASDYTRPSTIHPSQSSKTNSSDTKKAKNEEEEEEENEVILQKLGVLTAESNASRNGKTYSSGRSRRKSQWTDGSDLESQERRARNRRRIGLERARRRNGQFRCGCCTPRVCIMITFGIVVSLAIALYFLVPRAPNVSFESFSSTQLPVTTADRIQESFDIQLLIDSTNNYVPIKVNALNINVILQPDMAKIADDYGFSPSLTIQPRVAQVFSIPMMLDYRSKYGSNNTLQDLIEVCTPVNVSSNATVPGMNITIRGAFHVWGLSWVWRPSFALDVNNVPCPVNSKASNNGSPSTSSTATKANVTSITQGPIETTAAAMAVNLATETAT